jgi:hypothetical protein
MPKNVKPMLATLVDSFFHPPPFCVGTRRMAVNSNRESPRVFAANAPDWQLPPV